MMQPIHHKYFIYWVIKKIKMDNIAIEIELCYKTFIKYKTTAGDMLSC